MYQNGQTVRGPLFAVKYVLNPRRQGWRLAVVVGKKVHKSAVARNRIRRRIYGAARRLSPDIARPYDIVVTVYSDELLLADSAKLNQMLKNQLGRAGILAKRAASKEKS